MRIPAVLLFILSLILNSGCNRKEQEERILTAAQFIIKDFNALTGVNEGEKDTIKQFELDYTNAVTEGFKIPNVNQISSGYFICKFYIRNTSEKAQRYSYKVFYQNESYKMDEVNSSGEFNHLSSENFYGSYPDTLLKYKSTDLIPADGKFHEITDSIQIVGNPRNEKMYYTGTTNDRWKRNPRVGLYSFLLSVTTEDNLKAALIPGYIQDVSLSDSGLFISPYYFFNYGEGKNISNLLTAYSVIYLKVIAKPDLGSGIYVDEKFNRKGFIDKKETNCGIDTSFYSDAAFSQFIHFIDASTRMDNIPLIADVLKDNYSKRDYNWNRSFYRKEELIGVTPTTARRPCETVYSDAKEKKIVIHNPKAVEGKWKKENVGIISRHGLTYGKVCVKAKLTELLNKNNVWNGITNAIWLITQNEEPWNWRRPCNKEGYMATYWGGRDDKRVNQVAYAEIDFEILKTPAYCPAQSFPPIYKNPTNNIHDIESWDIPLPEEILKDDGNITVACTNWDMACADPENFGWDCKPVLFQDKKFETHRWDKWYRAITEKSPASDDLLFGSKYFYFEIEWKPTEIIWRIGPEKDKMHVVGYMNDKITNIPNNQMLLIVTQEFHNTQWWPGSPYQQKYIPFPANDIFGEIFEVTIE